MVAGLSKPGFRRGRSFAGVALGECGGLWLLAGVGLAHEQVLDPLELPGRHFQLTSADAWTSQLKVAACGCSEQGLLRQVVTNLPATIWKRL